MEKVVSNCSVLRQHLNNVNVSDGTALSVDRSVQGMYSSHRKCLSPSVDWS